MPFKILSIDGGGIRGIFPAKFLAQVEANLRARGVENWQTHKNFDLICGTSTGGILAIGLALGIPAIEIHDLYINNAKAIFGNKRFLLQQLWAPAHERKNLEAIIQKKFQDANGGQDPRLNDMKTHICIPVYDLMEGRPTVLKSRYHLAFVRDYHMPAYIAALATSAAPTYFKPYSTCYQDLNGQNQIFHNKVDGGVYANNPTLNGIIEAQKAFNKELSDLAVLSIGTGHQKFCDAGIKPKNYGLGYWILRRGRKPIIELFMQGQSQQVQNLISLMKNGIDRREPDNFIYTRIDTELDTSCFIEMDESDKNKLTKLSEKANTEFQINATTVLRQFYNIH